MDHGARFLLGALEPPRHDAPGQWCKAKDEAPFHFAERAADDRLAIAVRKLLESSGHLEVVRVAVLVHQGVIALRGTVSRYYLKQLAQEAALRLARREGLRNEIAVISHSRSGGAKMSLDFHEVADGKILNVKVSGKLTKADYERFVPETDRLIEKHGKIRILFEMHDFHGWQAAAMWEDTKFGVKHFKDIERLAVVGEKAWEHGMAIFCKPFTTATVRYFDRSQADEAQAWIATS